MEDPAKIVEGVDDIVQSINIILTTIPGSDPLRPEFGSNVYQYLDKPLPSVMGKIIYEATTAIGRWENPHTHMCGTGSCRDHGGEQGKIGGAAGA